MKESFQTLEAAEDFLKARVEEQKYVVSMRALPTGEFQVEWQEHKNYVAFDGQTFPDEVWITEDQRMILVQDLEPEHARNVLRMILRQEREVRDRMEQLMTHIIEAADEMLNDSLDEDDSPPDGQVLH
jgi:hypothetical protein